MLAAYKLNNASAGLTAQYDIISRFKNVMKYQVNYSHKEQEPLLVTYKSTND